MEQSPKTYSFEEAKRLMEQYCIYRDRCHKEVEAKIWSLRMTKAEHDAILEHLITEKYLDESRYVQSFVRGKFNQNRWGRKKIVNQLKFNQISDYNIRLGLKEIDESEYRKTMLLLIEKKSEALGKAKNFKNQNKVLQYLVQKGFEYDLSLELIKEVLG